MQDNLFKNNKREKIFNRMRMPNNKLLLKIFLVVLFFELISRLPRFNISDLIADVIFASVAVVVVAILQKWYLEYKNYKAEKIVSNNIVEKSIATEYIAKDVSQKEKKSLIWINIIFIVFSLINSFAVTSLASLRGAARAQGEVIYFIIFPVYIVLAVVATIISFRYLHKKYIIRGWLAAILLPVSALAMEELGIFLLDSGLNYFLTVILITIVTVFIFFSPSFTQLFKILTLKSENNKRKSSLYYSIIVIILILGLLIIVSIPFFIIPKIKIWYSSSFEENIHRLYVATLEDPDKDNDGISNTDEINIYGTDPENNDSNNNGISDRKEIYDTYKNNILEKNSKILSLYKNNIREKGINSIQDIFERYSLQPYNFYVGLPDDVVEIVKNSLKLRIEKKFQDSLELLKIALKNNPDSWIINYHIGLSYHGMEDYKKALEYYADILQYKEAINPLLYQDIAASYYGLGNESKFVEYLQKSTEDFPEYLGAYSRIAQYYMDINELSVAKKELERGLKIEPRYSDFYNSLGLIAGKEGNKSEEIGYYKKAIGLDFHNAAPHMNLSISYREDFDEPRDALIEALIANEFDSDNSHIKNVLGLAYGATGALDQAITEYQKGIEMDSTYDKLYNNLGIAYADKKQFSLAEQNYKKAIEINAEYAKAYSNLGTLYFNQGLANNFTNDEYLKAKPYLEKAVNIDGEWYLSRQTLGRIYQVMAGKGEYSFYPQSELNFKKSVELKYDEILSHRQLGFVYFTQGKEDDAIREWSIAISLGMNDQDINQIIKNIQN